MRIRIFNRFCSSALALIFAYLVLFTPIYANTISFTDALSQYETLGMEEIYTADDIMVEFTYTATDGTSYRYSLASYNALSDLKKAELCQDAQEYTLLVGAIETSAYFGAFYSIYAVGIYYNVITIDKCVLDLFSLLEKYDSLADDYLDNYKRSYYDALLGDPIDSTESFMDYEQYYIGGGELSNLRGATFDSISIGDCTLEFCSYGSVAYSVSDSDKAELLGYSSYSYITHYTGIKLTSSAFSYYSYYPYAYIDGGFVRLTNQNAIIVSKNYSYAAPYYVSYKYTDGDGNTVTCKSSSVDGWNYTYGVVSTASATVIGIVDIDGSSYLAIDFGLVRNLVSKKWVSATLYYPISVSVAWNVGDSISYNEDEPYGTLININNDSDSVSDVYVRYDADSDLYYYCTEDGFTYSVNTDKSATVGNEMYYYKPNLSTYNSEYIANYLNAYYTYYYSDSTAD